MSPGVTLETTVHKFGINSFYLISRFLFQPPFYSSFFFYFLFFFSSPFTYGLHSAFIHLVKEVLTAAGTLRLW